MNISERKIPYGRQNITEDDIRAVVSVLTSDFLTQGPKINEFESAVSGLTGAKYAVALSSATAALHLACLALGADENTVAITSPNTFVASANCILYTGGSVDFADIEPDTLNMNPVELEKALSRHPGKKKIIIPVHFAGHSCDMAEIRRIADKFGARIMEDASHAVGGSYAGGRVGNCRYSDISVFSFHPVKIVTTGEGGIALTNDEQVAEKMMLLRSHGITRNPERMETTAEGPWFYEQQALGFNFRMTDLQAALGISQFGRLEDFLRRRREIRDRYDQALRNLPIVLPTERDNVRSAWHLYPVRLRSGKISRREVYEKLQQRGIFPQIHYIPVHWQPFYRELGFRKGDFPEAEKYYNQALSLPVYFDLQPEDQERVIGALEEILR